MPVVLNIVESETALGVLESQVVIESASEPGPAGAGVPAGGAVDQVLAKASGDDYDTEWVDQTGGGGSGVVETIVEGPGISVDATDPANPEVSLSDETYTSAEKTKLAGIETGATADQTAAEILTAIKTVDGAGSGLDADLLDGLSSAAFATAAQGTAADAAKTKTDFLTVTQAVDLDTIEARVNSLDAAVVLRGNWDASAGTFPGSGTAQAGDSYIVTVAGTVNSVAFSVGDRIVAITDNASTGTYAANWLKLDYTDQVLSVNSRTGAVSGLAEQSSLDTVESDLATAIADGDASTLTSANAFTTTHINDTSDAHDASAISIADAGNDFTATDVEGALAELQADHEADATALSDHIADASAAHAASAISYAGGTGMSATDVEAAIDELATEKANTADLPATYGPWMVAIATVTLGGAASSIDFDSIPGTYATLMLICSLRSDRSGVDNDSVRCTFNNDTTDANYDRQSLTVLGATVTGAYSSSGRILCAVPGATATTAHFAGTAIEIPGYAGANRKVAMARTTSPIVSGTSMQIEQRGLMWKSTSAITRVTLTPNTGPNFVAGSTVTLYGLAAGPT